jgi:hypothetical protein
MSIIAWIVLGLMLAGALGLLLAWCLLGLEPVALALVSFGEGWHNMHHSDPAAAYTVVLGNRRGFPHAVAAGQRT